MRRTDSFQRLVESEWYPIGTGDAEVIRALTERIDGPVIVAFGGGERPVGEFAALGGARQGHSVGEVRQGRVCERL